MSVNLSNFQGGYSSGVRRGKEHMRKLAAAKRLPQLCPCGLPRLDGHIVCLCCWKAAPGDAKRGILRSNPLEVRRAATSALLRFAMERKGTVKPQQRNLSL